MRPSRRTLFAAIVAIAAAATSLDTAPLGAQPRDTQPRDTDTQDANAQVRATVERYLHGLKHNDIASLKQAFWPDAKLYFVQRGTLGQLTQLDWYKSFEKSAGKVEAGDFRIVSVEVTSDIASVKVVEDWPGNTRYTDYLSLVRFDGTWKIVNKVYTSEKR